MIWWLDVTIINKTSCDTYKSNDMYSKLHITYEKESLNSDGLTKRSTTSRLESWNIAIIPLHIVYNLYQDRAIAVFPVFRLLTDFVCLLTYEFCLSLWKIARCSVILLLPLLEIQFLVWDRCELYLLVDDFYFDKTSHKYIALYSHYLFVLNRYFWRTNYRHFLLVLAWLLPYRSVHPIKCPLILNVTLGLIFDGNICNISAQTDIRNPLVKLLILTHNRVWTAPIIAILLDMENEI